MKTLKILFKNADTSIAVVAAISTLLEQVKSGNEEFLFRITEIAESMVSSGIVHCLNELGIVKKAQTGFLTQP